MRVSSFFCFILFSLLYAHPKLCANDGKTDIYLAGPLFTTAERQFNTELAKELRDLGYTLFVPQEVKYKEFTARTIFSTNVMGIDHCHIIVAIFDGSDPDSGTCWECGYAYAKGKPIIAVRTDFRGIGDGNLAPYNLMLSESATGHAHISSLECDIKMVAQTIDKQLKNLKNSR